jgi:hypothetical protein
VLYHHGILCRPGATRDEDIVVHVVNSNGVSGSVSSIVGVGKPKPIVEYIKFAEFRRFGHGPVYCAQYEAPTEQTGRYPCPPLPPEEVVQRAEEAATACTALESADWSQYEVFTRNCEHFAVYIKSGKMMSEQVERFFVSLREVVTATLTNSAVATAGAVTSILVKQAVVRGAAQVTGAVIAGETVKTASRALVTGSAAGLGAAAAGIGAGVVQLGMVAIRYFSYLCKDDYSWEDFKCDTKRDFIAGLCGLVGAVAFCWCPPASIAVGAVAGFGGAMLAQSYIPDVDADVRYYSLVSKVCSSDVHRDSSLNRKRIAYGFLNGEFERSYGKDKLSDAECSKRTKFVRSLRDFLGSEIAAEESRAKNISAVQDCTGTTDPAAARRKIKQMMVNTHPDKTSHSERWAEHERLVKLVEFIDEEQRNRDNQILAAAIKDTVPGTVLKQRQMSDGSVLVVNKVAWSNVWRFVRVDNRWVGSRTTWIGMRTDAAVKALDEAE